jgi:hypothetical protein
MMRTLLIALALTTNFGVTASANDDTTPTRWEWRCQGSVHGMEVSPDGRQTTYRPEPRIGFQFRIREREEFLVSTLKLPWFFIEFEGSSDLWTSDRAGTQTLDGWGDDRGTNATASVDWSLSRAAEKNDLKQVHATLNRHLMAIRLERDDQDWRFIMSRTGVTTLRKARELRADVPIRKWEPSADVIFATGECVMRFTPKEPRNAGQPALRRSSDGRGFGPTP